MNGQVQTLDEEPLEAAESLAAAPALFVVLEADRPSSRGARYSLVGVETVTLGRGATRDAGRSDDGRTLDVRLPGQWISARHAVLHAVGNEWVVEDAASRNGTFVNGQRVARAALREGDVLEVGHVFLMLRGAPASQGPVARDEDAGVPHAPFGMRTLLPELQENYAALARVARRSDVPVMLLGPSGTGKEALAREVHAQSGRSGAFVAVHCGALSAPLVESVLCGHVQGAFPGADRDEPGLLRTAEGGTLLLDEIGDLPASSQAALLRVLQENEMVPVGSARPVKVDVRIVTATHRPLQALIADGAFRADLLGRLKGYTHPLLSLRERMPDFGLLLADVLERVASAEASSLRVAPDAARALMSYAWPNNIRELHQTLATAIALGVQSVLEAKHLPPELLAPQVSGRLSARPSAETDDATLRDRLVVLLRRHHGNITAVARAMGKAPTQIHRWTRRLQIDVAGYREG